VILQTKHKVLLWVPALLYAALILGDWQRDIYGGLIYRIYMRGAISSLLILMAAALITGGTKSAFITGIVCWILGLAALALANTTVAVIHF
jgi:hypothetical protein